MPHILQKSVKAASATTPSARLACILMTSKPLTAPLCVGVLVAVVVVAFAVVLVFPLPKVSDGNCWVKLAQFSLVPLAA